MRRLLRLVMPVVNAANTGVVSNSRNRNKHHLQIWILGQQKVKMTVPGQQLRTTETQLNCETSVGVVLSNIYSHMHTQ